MKQIGLTTKLRALLLLVVMLTASLRASAQVAEFEKYADEKGVSYVYVSKMMLSLASKLSQSNINVGNVKMGKLTKQLHSIQVISAESASAIKKLQSDVLKVTKQKSYELMMQAGDDSDKTRIYYKEAQSKKDNAVIIIFTYDERNCSVVVLTGKFTQEDLQSLGGVG